MEFTCEVTSVECAALFVEIILNISSNQGDEVSAEHISFDFAIVLTNESVAHAL